MSFWLDDVLVVDRGGRAPSYREEDGQRVMKQDEITVRVALGRGTRRGARLDLRLLARLRVDQRRLPQLSCRSPAEIAALLARLEGILERVEAVLPPPPPPPDWQRDGVPLAQARGARLSAGGRASARDPPRRSRRHRRAEARRSTRTRGSSSPGCRRTTCC